MYICHFRKYFCLQNSFSVVQIVVVVGWIRKTLDNSEDHKQIMFCDIWMNTFYSLTVSHVISSPWYESITVIACGFFGFSILLFIHHDFKTALQNTLVTVTGFKTAGEKTHHSLTSGSVHVANWFFKTKLQLRFWNYRYDTNQICVCAVHVFFIQVWNSSPLMSSPPHQPSGRLPLHMHATQQDSQSLSTAACGGVHTALTLLVQSFQSPEDCKGSL